MQKNPVRCQSDFIVPYTFVSVSLSTVCRNLEQNKQKILKKLLILYLDDRLEWLFYLYETCREQCKGNGTAVFLRTFTLVFKMVPKMQENKQTTIKKILSKTRTSTDRSHSTSDQARELSVLWVI